MQKSSIDILIKYLCYEFIKAYDNEAPKISVFKYDLITLWKVAPWNARNSQQLFRIDETIVASFLLFIVLLFKVLLNHNNSQIISQ